MNDLCVNCSSRNLCRAICPVCSQSHKRYVYCVDCRKIPLTKHQCKKHHNYVKTLTTTSIHRFGSVCDLCAIAGPLRGKTGYSDYECDVYVCEECYKDLPEHDKEKEEKEPAKELNETSTEVNKKWPYSLLLMFYSYRVNKAYFVVVSFAGPIFGSRLHFLQLRHDILVAHIHEDSSDQEETCSRKQELHNIERSLFRQVHHPFKRFDVDWLADLL